MQKRLYFDYAATTPVSKKVIKAMLPFFDKSYGNPSSIHRSGQVAMAAIDEARVKLAAFLDCELEDIIFTSGATEANNIAILGLVKNRGKKIHIITSEIEHESVLSPIRMLQEKGLVEATFISPSKEGILSVKDIEKAIKKNTALVSIGYANGEIGIIQPIAEIGKMLKDKDIVFHTDAVQAVNFLDCSVEKLGVDMLTLSSHKIYGPKGVGVLYLKKSIRVNPLVFGGGQEMGLRSGTENVPAIVGFGTAIEEVQDPKIKIRKIPIRQMRDKLISGILNNIPGSYLLGSKIERIPGNVSVRFDGVLGRDVVMALDQKGIAVSSGSACSERSHEHSHVLSSLGFDKEESLGQVRITLGRQTKKEDIETLLKILTQVVEKVRKNKI